MFEISKTYRQEVPEMRFIGKKYGDEDRVNGTFSEKWNEWLQNDWFGVIENAVGGESKAHAVYEDGDAYISLMRACGGEPFQYWIGMFTPPETPVPEGYDCVDFVKAAFGVCWLCGPEYELYGHEFDCEKRLEREGMELVPDPNSAGGRAWWFMERCGCPRFTVPDEKGNIILDICYYVK
jgi:hypothetical protein